MAQPTRKRLSSTHEVIIRLGGVAKVAEMTGCVETAVYNWRSYDRFPPRLYVMMVRELRKRRAEAPHHLWQQDERVA